MCKLCARENLQNHYFASRRDFLKGAAAIGVSTAGLNLFAARPAAADDDDPPEGTGRPGRRYVIRGGSVMTMDPRPGVQSEFVQADVLVEGKKILAVGPNIGAGDAGVIDARGRIVMPGFIDTHHHQFETALRSFLADGVLINDGSGTPSGSVTYYEYILLKFAPVYRPQDVYINELFGGLSQLDDGVTTVHDVSQIHHTPQHSDAAVQALFDTGRRAAFGYFEGAGEGVTVNTPGYAYPQDAFRLVKNWFSSSDQLVHMIMGGEVYLGAPAYTQSWQIGRQLGLQIAAHILSPFSIRPIFDLLAQGKGGAAGANIGIGPDNLFIHMTGMSDLGWQAVKDKGAQVSIAFPIEMNMRHGMPPILKLQSLGMEPALSVDVEVTLTADFFTQMRSAMNLQRALVNQMILDQGSPPNPVDWGLPPAAAANPWPKPPAGLPAPLTTRDVLRYATMNGAKALRLDDKVGSITPGKEADIIILDATRINVAPLNQVPGAVVSLMDRTNVETVIVAGKVRKWKGRLLDVDLPALRRQLEASRDYLFSAAGIPQDLFRSN
ncbi:MAG TPA: amidohydrolase family protein [Xanthobacteraceae bacterium]|jgi:cytosine/adenosine deaminase-related metal-dependent hydrolase|nr:amidohydrolase family protein [Xanthobacteraceae bacterium]